MPSFFQGLKRIIQGKPVFDENDMHPSVSHPGQQQPLPPAPAPQQPAQPESTIRKGDDRTFPSVFVRRINTRLNGPNMEVYARIYNSWHDEIELDKIRMFGLTRELDNRLRAGEDREFLIYKGPRLQRPQYEAELDYKTTHTGDYFKAIHDVKLTYQSDKTYSVDEMRLHPPIRDIYG